jgi:hypothetical protein
MYLKMECAFLTRSMKGQIVSFWVVQPCSPVGGYQILGGEPATSILKVEEVIRPGKMLWKIYVQDAQDWGCL